MKVIGMRRVLAFFFVLLAVSAIAPAASAQSPFSAPATTKKPPQVRVTLIADKATVRPGETVTVAFRQTIATGWHTYWVNPGDAGDPTTVDWTLPQGATAGELQWPLPDVISIGTLTDYGYSGEVLLLADVTLPQTLSGPSADIAARVSWLVCKEICVPEETTVRLNLLVDASGAPSQPSSQAAEIATARANLPASASWPAQFEATSDALTLQLDNFEALPPGAEVRLFPLKPDVIDNTHPQVATVADGALLLRMARADTTTPAPPRFDGVLVITSKDASGQLQRRGYVVGGTVCAVEGTRGPTQPQAATGGESAAPPASALQPPVAVSSPPTPARESLSFGMALAFAFLGGLILNLMPCVFPVLSLKALSLAREAAPAERQMHGTAYLLGVLTSCVTVAAALVALRAGGETIGWGTQFQSPAFVLGMMTLFMALGLNMSGVFELGGRLLGAGDALTRVPGFTGYFFTGVLAAVVATPCTAPFMGAAIGYAFTQPAVRLFAVLLALGVGFALPMLALSYLPALGRWLPKPGAWMATFKGVMAFPLYATAGWLLWVLAVQLGSDGVLAGLVTLLGVAFAAWLVGAADEPHPLRSGIAAAVAVAAIVGGIAVLPAAAPTEAHIPAAANGHASGLPYEPFSAARLQALRASSKPVFVNLTAAWCITCKVNERVALRSVRIAETFAARGIVPLKGDWTNADPEITALLQSFGRAGVPLYLLYPAGGGEPQVFPQLLTESIVLDGIAAMPGAHAAKRE